MFENKRILNNGVSGAVIEDYLSIFYLYEKRNITPKVVIIGLDPWILNDQNDETRWKSIANDYYIMLKKIGLKDLIDQSTLKTGLMSKMEKYFEIVSFTYFQESLLSIISKSSYYPTENKINDKFTKLVDGSIFYDKKFRDRTSKEVELAAKALINSKQVYALGDFQNMSLRNRQILEAFIKYLKQKDINVYFFLSPYHPIVYDFFAEDNQFKIVLETEKYFVQLAKQNQIKIFGSFNPHIYKFTNSDFYDGMHCTKDAISSILFHNTI